MVYCTVTNDLNQDRRMRRIGEVIQKNNIDFTLIGRKKRDSLPLQATPFHQKRLNCFFQAGPFFYLEINLRLFFYLVRYRPKVVYAVDLDTLGASVAYKKLLGCRLIFDAHEYFEEVPELIGRPLVKKIWERLARWGIPQADLAITVGKALGKELEDKYNVPFKVIRNTRKKNQHVVPINPPLQSFRILYLGVLNPGRGLEELIGAMAELEDCELWIAGTGPLEKRLKQIAIDTGAGARVFFKNFLEGKEIEDFLAEGHLGCNLLNSKSKSYSLSLANKTFDYLHYGIPGMHMNLPEYQEIQQQFDCFLLLDELSTEAIVETVQTLKSDRIRYQILSKNNLLARNHFDWESETSFLINWLKQLEL